MAYSYDHNCIFSFWYLKKNTIMRLSGNGTNVYEYDNWVPGLPRRHENVSVIAFMSDGNRYRSVGISIRII